MRPSVMLCLQGSLLACAVCVPLSALAQPAAPAGPKLGIVPSGIGTAVTNAAPAQGVADPIVGSVEGHLIYLSDLGEASKNLPANLRGLPFDTIYPVLLDRMIDHEALVIMAKRKGLEEKKKVQQEIQASTERILEGAYLGEAAVPRVTEEGILSRYNRLYANRPPTEEVHARHILLTTEAEARKVIEDLKKGTDFAAVARVLSKDPDGAKGGDLGFFRREQVWPNFADAAFALQPGQVAPNPVKNEFGWHVIKVEEKRMVARPSFSQMHDQLRQELLAVAVKEAIEKARAALAIHRFNLDGSELDTGPRLNVSGTDGAQAQ